MPTRNGLEDNGNWYYMDNNGVMTTGWQQIDGQWYYMDQAVPDRVSIIENEEEEFSFGLPLKATISSDSQEVALSNESNIPADQITISGRDHFSMFGGRKGKLPGRS